MPAVRRLCVHQAAQRWWGRGSDLARPLAAVPPSLLASRAERVRVPSSAVPRHFMTRRCFAWRDAPSSPPAAAGSEQRTDRADSPAIAAIDTAAVPPTARAIAACDSFGEHTLPSRALSGARGASSSAHSFPQPPTSVNGSQPPSGLRLHHRPTATRVSALVRGQHVVATGLSSWTFAP